jgi:SAM-dependent methyltransferase
MTELPGILNVGCGAARIPGSIGVDIDPESAADVIHDLDIHPWPFPDQAFDRIVCSHVLEHLKTPWKAMQELIRLSRPGARVEIATPHYSSPDSWGDITHYMHYSLKTWEPYYQRRNAPAPFELVSRRLTFGHGLPSLIARATAALLGFSFYEKYVCFVFRAGNMELVLRRRAEGP